MSEPNPNPEVSAQAAAAKAAAEKQAARVAELKTYAGKYFKRKDGKGEVVRVTGYGGIGIHQEMVGGKAVAVQSHLFSTDTFYTPPATRFLEDYIEVEAPKTATPEVV